MSQAVLAKTTRRRRCENAMSNEDPIPRDGATERSNSNLGTIFLPEGASIFSRKVARSGHISYEGRPYFISKALAGRYIRLVVIADRLIVDASIPLHKEYPLI
jgi:hypothetical protein